MAKNPFIIHEEIEELDKHTKKLTMEQSVRFAWICAVRALPFLSVLELRFSYWEYDNKQKHLYNVFHSLDRVAEWLYSGTAVGVTDPSVIAFADGGRAGAAVAAILAAFGAALRVNFASADAYQAAYASASAAYEAAQWNYTICRNET